MRWDEAAARWIVKTNRGDAIKARFVVLASGPLHRPKLPGIPGIESFKGHTFHTSRWDYAYTGGDSNGNLTRPEGQARRHHRHRRHRHAVRAASGRGREASLCLPAHAVLDRRAQQPPDRSRSGRSRLTPGWQKQRMDNFNILLSGGYQDEDLVSDGWTDIIRNLILGQGAKKFAAAGADDDAEAAGRARRLREDGTGPRPRRRDREGQGDRRGAEALVPPVLQAAVLPRRISRHLQPAERHAGRHEGRGRRAHHRRRRRRERHRISGRLPDLRDRLRGRHRLHAPRGLRTLRPRRPDAVRQMGEGRAHVPRLPRRRLPELLRHLERAVGLHRELPAHAGRTGEARRLRREALHATRKSA